MSQKGKRRHFIIKHDLDSFEKLPNFIWTTNVTQDAMPFRYKEVVKGSRWIRFAYTLDETERPLSLVTGFSECIREATYRRVPKTLPFDVDYAWARKGYAWMIEGESWGRQPRQPVGVLPINDILSPKRVWNNQAIIPITGDDFEKIREHALGRQFDARTVPLIEREPECEQELLAVVISGYKKLGIEKIIRVRKAFPDLLVQINGKEVHLELEVYSNGFFQHGHDAFVRNRRFTDDGIPVAVLCWIHNCPTVENRVTHVYELRKLIREKRTITS